ncbi:uncharacterized protein LOC110982494 [Acanthaster planci]|uniref:Uncharacterized protein LOC110982494 n=1 Tax=Acanthaster planci TaxID=133434 RepID=A0A8B7YTK4_ACAPL|nr:uncharacterized protein LOC110982494 [Acanthaster planci]
MEHERLKTFADTEHLHSGNLTLGDQKKDGMQISFKDKSRRFYVLRCFRQKFLTLSGYKNMKEYKAPSGGHHKTVEQIVVSQNAKILSMQLPSKKHKASHVLCIIQDKQTVYLEADTSEDLTAWCDVFNDIFIRLGWKQPPSSPPPSPAPPPPDRPASSDDKVPSRRKVKSGPLRGSTFELFQNGEESNQLRFSSPPINITDGGSAASAFDFERPKSSQAEYFKEFYSFSETADFAGYVNVHKVVDRHGLHENSQMHEERVVDMPNIGYVNLRGKEQHHERVHPGPPPSLPPRPNRHKRGNTFPGTHLPTHDSSVNQYSTNSGDDVNDDTRPVRANSEHTPKISVNESEPPISPLTSKRFLHLHEDSDVNRKISLPQPLNSKPRRLGIVVPPCTMCISPPDSPVMLRKTGSYSNLSLNLSSRPLPSPVHGDSFDVNTLRWEMSHKDGFPIVLKKTDLQDALGLVRIADFVWIAGWKAGKSEVANKLHVGDQLRQVNEQIVVDPSVSNSLFATSAVDEILLVIKRLPHAKVRNLHRSSVDESWGLEVEGNRVLNVSKSGPAAEAKLTTRAQGAFSERLCDWIITEINGEPVSLLSKKDQVKVRMDSAGLQMTLVIQPDDFIKKLNSELQKVRFAHEYFLGPDSQDQ